MVAIIIIIKIITIIIIIIITTTIRILQQNQSSWLTSDNTWSEVNRVKIHLPVTHQGIEWTYLTYFSQFFGKEVCENLKKTAKGKQMNKIIMKKKKKLTPQVNSKIPLWGVALSRRRTLILRLLRALYPRAPYLWMMDVACLLIHYLLS